MGNLEALQYAHERGAPLTFETLKEAVWAGSLECLQYLHKQGCPQEHDPGIWIRTDSLPVLRYVSEYMDPALAARV
jgi:hypothetical protein